MVMTIARRTIYFELLRGELSGVLLERASFGYIVQEREEVEEI